MNLPGTTILNSPGGGTVSSLVIVAGEVSSSGEPQSACHFAGTAVGVYRQVGSGDWQHLPNSPLGVICLAVSASNSQNRLIFAGTSAGIFLSKDQGQNWQSCILPISGSTILALAFSPDGSLLLAGTLEDGVFCSTTHGRTWESRNFGLLDQSVFSLAFSPEFSRDGTVFISGESALYHSYNHARAWKELPFPPESLPVLSLAVSPEFVHHPVIFAGTEENGLFISDNHGLDWKASPLGVTTVNSLHFINQHSLLAATDTGLYQSDDTGLSWQLVIDAPDALCLASNNRTILSGWSETGVLEFSDQSNWKPAAKFNARPFSGMLLATPLHQEHRIFLYSPSEGLWRSQDSANSWDCINPLLPFENLNHIDCFSGRDSQPGLAAATEEGVWLSTDFGENWLCIHPEPASLVWFSAVSGFLTAVFQQAGAAFSTNWGKTWETLNGPWQHSGQIIALAASPRQRFYLAYLEGMGGEISFWQGIPGELEEVLRMPAGENPVVSFWVPSEAMPDRPWYASLGSKVWKFSERRSGASIQSSLLPGEDLSESIVSLMGKQSGDSLTLFACTGRRLFSSRDDARTWTPVHDFHPHRVVRVSLLNDERFYVLQLGGELLTLKIPLT